MMYRRRKDEIFLAHVLGREGRALRSLGVRKGRSDETRCLKWTTRVILGRQGTGMDSFELFVPENSPGPGLPLEIALGRGGQHTDCEGRLVIGWRNMGSPRPGRILGGCWGLSWSRWGLS